MKNLFGICAVVCTLAMFSSCKKDYTCTCTYAGQTIVTELKDAKKSEAEDACSALEVTAKLVDASASCSL